MITSSIWAPFDYEEMARDSKREQDVLKDKVQERRAKGPGSPDEAMVWDQQTRRLYGMYLEQRKTTQELSRRAKKRRMQIWDMPRR